MKNSFILALSVFFFATSVGASSSTYDADLKDAPQYYRERVQKFRNILRKEKSKNAKIDRALAMARSLKSPFRKDALNFLADLRVERAVPLLTRLTSDPEVQEFALYALGQIGTEKSVEVLIQNLKSPNEKMRGISENSLRKISGVNFSYRYGDSPRRRKEGIQEIELWWKKEKKKGFQPRKLTSQEAEEAKSAWEQYGVEYLHDLSR